MGSALIALGKFLREIFPCPFWLLMAPTVLLFFDRWQQNDSSALLTWPFPPMCQQISPFKDTSHWIKAYAAQDWPYLNLITSAKILLPNKVTFPRTRAQDSNMCFRGTQFSP